MDLAIELGAGSVHQLMQRMPADELAGWWQYAQKRLLPSRRIELYLAQLAQIQAGGKLDDFLLKPATPEAEAPTADESAAFLGSVGGGKVHVLHVDRMPWQDQLDAQDRREAKGR